MRRLALILAAVALLTGCGSGGGDDGSSPGGTPTETREDSGPYGY